MAGWHHWLNGRVWVNSRSWWWTGKPGVLQSVGSQRVGPNWVTELNWCFLPLPLDYKLHEARDSLFIHHCISGSFIVPGTYQILNKHWFSQSIQLSINFFHLFSVFKWIQVSHNMNLHHYEPENDNTFSTYFHYLKVLRIILKFFATCEFFKMFIYLAVPCLSYTRQTLSCGMWDLVPSTGIKPGPSALGVWSLSLWTTREVPATCEFYG